MIKINKPKFWDEKRISFYSILLLPLTLIAYFIIFLRKIFAKNRKFQIPIICVGNIYIGGTGKTPTSILIAKELERLGVKSAILRKYYKDHIDEYNLIQNSCKNLITNKKRKLGILEAKKKGYKTLVLDDGLQDYDIFKDLSIVCFNLNQKIGNGFIIPSGPLREGLYALKNTNIALLNGDRDQEFEKKLIKINKNLEIYYSYYKPININEFKDHNLLALAGIANPENFFKLLKKNNLSINQKLVYPDHYKFSKEEVVKIIKRADESKLKIIMTEKDFFKVNSFNLPKLNYLKISLEIKDKENFFNSIQRLYD